MRTRLSLTSTTDTGRAERHRPELDERWHVTCAAAVHFSHPSNAMGFVTRVIGLGIGLLGGLVCGAVAVGTAGVWLAYLERAPLVFIHAVALLAIGVLWGLVRPAHVAFSVRPVLLLFGGFELPGLSGAGLGGSVWLGGITSAVVVLGALAIGVALLIGVAVLGVAGSVLFWAPALFAARPRRAHGRSQSR
ncbi:MAG: hypothetical protein AAF460_13645 [Pseudomonadota bacterium]